MPAVRPLSKPRSEVQFRFQLCRGCARDLLAQRCGNAVEQLARLHADLLALAPHESRQRHIRTSDIASLGQIERELYEVEEQLVSKKIAERLPVSESATLAALERVDKARKELEEASRAPHCAGQRRRLAVMRYGQNRIPDRKKDVRYLSDRPNIYFFSIESNLFSSNQFAP